MKSTTASALHTAEQAAAPMSDALVGLFAVCAGVLVADLYYAQPIIERIAPAVDLSAQSASVIVSPAAMAARRDEAAVSRHVAISTRPRTVH